MPKRVTAAAVVVLVLVVVAAAVLWWRSTPRTELQEAVAMAPPDAERLSWTDWAGVRESLGASLSATSGNTELGRFLDRGYEADLTSTSALLQSAPDLHARYGFSPATVDWELFSQSPQGAVVMLRLPESLDFADLEDRLTELGYRRPSSETGVWDGGEGLLSSIGSTLTPELQFISLDAERRLVLSSDTADYLTRAVEDAGRGDGPAADLREVAEESGEPLSASVYSGGYACAELAMVAADESDQAQAAQLLEAAGEVHPISGFAMSVRPDRHVEVVMSFEDDDRARTNADSRAALLEGPAPGQGGDFADRFEVDSVTADGRFVRMDLDPHDGQYVLSDLSTGPVLFATC